MAESKSPDRETLRLELLKLKLERARYRSEIAKWVAIAAGAVVSFVVIDYGKLTLERLRLDADNQIRFIEAYSKAMEAAEPEIWRRKLSVLQLFAKDDAVKKWVTNQVTYIEEFAALDALYRETLKTVSQLVDPATANEPERMKARKRYEQLYWSDLPFAGESSEVAGAMVRFRDGLVKAETTPNDAAVWSGLNDLLIDLSETLRRATRKSSLPSQMKPNP
jgi:hypothetical protein